MRDMTLSELDQLGAETVDSEATFQMDEDAFRLFYERTARPVWAYLSRMSGDSRLADDLLQEAYYRFLRTHRHYDNDEHRRNYLYRIATNLVRDSRRQSHAMPSALPDEEADSLVDEHARAVGRADLARAMSRLRPRERAVLWLAYAQGSSHEEIAGSLGVRKASVKQLLFRARKRLAVLLGRS